MVLRTINNKLILLEFLQIVLQIILLDFLRNSFTSNLHKLVRNNSFRYSTIFHVFILFQRITKIPQIYENFTQIGIAQFLQVSKYLRIMTILQILQFGSTQILTNGSTNI